MLTLSPSQLKVSREFQTMLERWHHDIWLTVTFGVRIDEYDAVRNIEHFFKRLNKPRGIYYYDSYIRCWLFTEQKPWQDRVHVHALVQRINPHLSSDLKVKCEEQLGKAYAEPYNPALPYRATQYISDKYALGWIKTYDFCKINSKWRWNKKAYAISIDDGNPTPIQANLSAREKWTMTRDALLLEQMEQGVELGV